MNTTKQKTRDCKTNEVMEKLSALKPRQPVFCPERLLFDVRNGTWSVETIRASGHVRRVNRPNTRLLLTKYINHKKGLAKTEPSTQDKTTKLPFEFVAREKIPTQELVECECWTREMLATGS